ncbi:hypothetical protein [Nitrincola sp. MINF-07-Sa-05]|uniref:hypothetical protein n=1 Tax=Nitrincola salilacus TaxID=3400273 RepID=UPI003917BC2B
MNSRIKKILIQSALAIMTLYFIINIVQPYGNLIIYATTVNRSEENLFEKFFINRYLSKLSISIRGISCNSPIITLPINLTQYEYTPFKDGSIILLIQQYASLDQKDNRRQKSYTLKLLDKTIQKCNLNTHMDHISPLVDAIFLEQSDVVKLLLERGADPNHELKSLSGSIRSPLIIARIFAQREGDRLEKNPNHPEATGQAKIILEIIQTHIEKLDSEIPTQ